MILVELVDCKDDMSVKEYLIERDKLHELLLHEELCWKKRAKVFWLADGDESTNFFHASASARKKNNFISHLVDEEGRRVEQLDEMCSIVRDYFIKVFIGDIKGVDDHQGVSPRTITREQNLSLIEDVSFEEFTIVVKQIHLDKASRPDGINPAFFQSFWDIIGHEVYKYYRSWLQNISFTA